MAAPAIDTRAYRGPGLLGNSGRMSIESDWYFGLGVPPKRWVVVERPGGTFDVRWIDRRLADRVLLRVGPYDAAATEAVPPSRIVSAHTNREPAVARAVLGNGGTAADVAKLIAEPLPVHESRIFYLDAEAALRGASENRCLRGHRKAGDNRTANGGCRACNRAHSQHNNHRVRDGRWSEEKLTEVANAIYDDLTGGAA